MEIKEIAHIENNFKSKFGIPRQAGLAEEIESRIVFENEFKNPDALRGLEGFSHIWLIWGFNLNEQKQGKWDATVRPPRLGGNRRIGVFASRSPNRPNPIGLSCVKIKNIDLKNVEISVLGADLADGTPIYDIKPYVPYADSVKSATGGFASDAPQTLAVEFTSDELKEKAERLLSPAELSALKEILSLDPRPAYQDDPKRIYGFTYSDCNIRFMVHDKCIYITEIINV